MISDNIKYEVIKELCGICCMHWFHMTCELI